MSSTTRKTRGSKWDQLGSKVREQARAEFGGRGDGNHSSHRDSKALGQRGREGGQPGAQDTVHRRHRGVEWEGPGEAWAAAL